MAPDEPPQSDDEPAVDDVVAGLIDEKPSRPRLSVVPPLAEAVAAARAKAAPDDPLADVLDPPGAPAPEPELVTDAFAASKPPTDELPALGKLLDLNTLSDGLRQIASWIDKQIPAFQQTVAQFLTTIEHSIVITPDGIKVAKKVAPDDATATEAASSDDRVLVSVPADASPPAEADAHDAAATAAASADDRVLVSVPADAAAASDPAPEAAGEPAAEASAADAPEPKDPPATD